MNFDNNILPPKTKVAATNKYIQDYIYVVVKFIAQGESKWPQQTNFYLVERFSAEHQGLFLMTQMLRPATEVEKKATSIGNKPNESFEMSIFPSKVDCSNCKWVGIINEIF